MIARLSGELIGFTAVVLAAVLVILLSGQLLQIGDLLLAAGPHAPWARALGGGLLILLEAALPLAGLLAAGLVYGRLRAEDAWTARAALGRHPAVALLPAVGLGCALGVSALALSHGPVPTAVQALRGTLIDAAGAALAVADRPLPLPGGGVARRVTGDAVWAALPGEGGRGALLVRAEDADLELVGCPRDPHDNSTALSPPLGVGPPRRTPGTPASGRLDRGRNGSRTCHADFAGTPLGDGRATLRLTDARLWSPDARIQVSDARLTVPAAQLTRRLGMLGPPNALPTAALDPVDVHHRFTAQRRSALPAMAPLWALLGALLGARMGGARAVAIGAAAVGLAYWLLRSGELTARAGFMSPTLAAWAPALVLALALAWILCRDGSLARPLR